MIGWVNPKEVSVRLDYNVHIGWWGSVGESLMLYLVELGGEFDNWLGSVQQLVQVISWL